MRNKMIKRIEERYQVLPDAPWEKTPDNLVFRHKDTKKWFCLIMKAPKTYLHTGKEGNEDVITMKCDPYLIDHLIEEEGFYRAFHMNKTQWLTIRLDGSVSEERIMSLLDASVSLTKKKKKK